jgi:uncharacterized protein (DUF58 family)
VQGLFVFLLLLLGITILLRMPPYFSVIYLIVMIYLISHIWTRRSIRRVSATRRFTDRAFFGDEVPVTLTIHNASLLPVTWLSARERMPMQRSSSFALRRVASLKANERWCITYTVDCSKRGVFPVGPLEMETGDLLGAMRTRTKELPADKLIVYPRVVPLKQLGLPTRSPLAALATHNPIFEDPSRITGVRDYQRGDSPRRIHWTATASAGRLLVKQFQPAIARDTHICLDLHLDSYDERRVREIAEIAITTAASLATHIISHEGLSAGLTTEAWDSVQHDWKRFTIPPRAERAHLMTLLETLARVQIAPDSDDPFEQLKRPPTATLPDLLRQESLHFPWGTTMIIITGQQTIPLLETLATLQKRGFALALILMQPSNSKAQPLMPLRGISTYRVWQDNDLEML